MVTKGSRATDLAEIIGIVAEEGGGNAAHFGGEISEMEELELELELEYEVSLVKLKRV